MQSGADSYAARREIRSCHIENERSCCHHERKVFPENKSCAMISLLNCPSDVGIQGTAITRACKKMEHTHFSRVDLVTAEGILVSTHLGSIGGGSCRCLIVRGKVDDEFG